MDKNKLVSKDLLEISEHLESINKTQRFILNKIINLEETLANLLDLIKTKPVSINQDLDQISKQLSRLNLGKPETNQISNKYIITKPRK